MESRRWLWLCTFAVSVVALDGQEPRPTFEVASVRKTVQPNPIAPAATAPDTFYRAGEVLPYFIRLAYNIQSFQLVSGPEWLRTDRFEINAKSRMPASPGQMRLMLQALLEERFKLVLRKEQRDIRHLALVVERKDLGPSLTQCADWLNPPPINASLKVPQGASFARNRCVELSEVAARATAARWRRDNCGRGCSTLRCRHPSAAWIEARIGSWPGGSAGHRVGPASDRELNGEPTTPLIHQRQLGYRVCP